VPRPPPVRCAIYTRQSVVRPATAEMTSCLAQRDLCEKLVRAHRMEGWAPLPERFDDQGFRGGTADRPQLERLLASVEAGEVDRVVTYRLDRITRSVSDWAKLVQCFRRHNVNLTIVQGEFAEGDLVTSDLMLNILAAFAEFESAMIGDRLRDAKAARRRRGLRTGGLLPFGFQANPKTCQLEAVPDEAAVVVELFKQAAAGRTPDQLAKWLDERGIKTKRSGRVGGERWSARGVLRLLRNKVYVGEIGGTRAAHAPLIDGEVFDAANHAVTTRQTRQPGRRDADEERDPFVLRGLLRCGQCGHLMTTARGARGKRKTAPRFYRCRSAPGACRGTQLRAQDIEHRVLTWLKEPANAKSSDEQLVLETLKPIWPVLFPQVTRDTVRLLVSEVRWGAARQHLSVVLDGGAIKDQAERFRRAQDTAEDGE